MGNSKNKRKSKKRKGTKNSTRSSTDPKENRSESGNKTITKPNPSDSIAMSKQLLQKKCSGVKQRSLSKNENRVCGSGKPIPCLADLERMFEDSDDDEQSSTNPKTNARQTCTTPTPEKPTVTVIGENKLLSPTTINRISERVMDMMSTMNPIELLKEIPRLPVIPPKKRKKSETPYIVGCKDRPKVISKPNTSFCKGDDEYGVSVLSEDQEEDSPPKKRARKSKIPTYSKSIFNAKCDEIAERLTEDNVEDLSDASSDSNKTIEYEQTQSLRPHTFSPLPSTSRDNETFIKNDELFNQSLNMINEIKDTSQEKNENELQIINIPYETIVIDDAIDIDKPADITFTSNSSETNNIKIFEQKQDTHTTHINGENYDDDCIVIESSTDHTNSNQPIIIDDEYSSIHVANDTLNTDTDEIIDVDDVIAENKSILDKMKNRECKEFHTINVVDVATTPWNLTTSQLSTSTSPHTTTTSVTNRPKELHMTNVVDVPTTHGNFTTSPITSTTPQMTVTSGINDNLNRTDAIHGTISHNNRTFRSNLKRNIQLAAASTTHSNVRVGNCNVIAKIVDDFFKFRPFCASHPKCISTNINLAKCLFDAIYNFTTQTTPPAQPTKPTQTHYANEETAPVSIETPQNVDCRIINQAVNLNHQSGISDKRQIKNLPVPSEPPRNIGDCPICMDPLSSIGIASTICGHVFCLKCIQAAIKSNGKKCPTCRKTLKGAGGGYHQLYL